MRYKFLCCILIFACLLGCKKEEEEHIFNEVGEDIVYSDSFSPREWERPSTRRHVISGDSQIGLFISDDVIDPRLRSIITTISNLIKINKTADKDDLVDYLSPAAYNSFILRNSDLLITEKYTLRIQLPENQTATTYWLKFKILFKKVSFIGRVELTFDRNNKATITDFDNDFFQKLKEYFAEKNNKKK